MYNNISPHDDGEQRMCTTAEELLTGLHSDDEVERVATALLLAELGASAESAVVDLVAVLEGTGGREARWSAAYALRRIGRGANRAVPSLLRAVDDPDQKVRDEVVRALDAILARDGEFPASVH